MDILALMISGVRQGPSGVRVLKEECWSAGAVVAKWVKYVVAIAGRTWMRLAQKRGDWHKKRAQQWM